ncbi:MFS transporter [Varibaculum prostatecancerukia]|uniref:MFS transporter n=1 Tax=Varibaculum prostatecancerukia TaxID=2811781 RepID=UPI001C002238|nr:MFS transporter [Varibaculum prostatecancerukia]
MSRTFTSFKYHNYRLWWMSNIFASTGLWMQRVAQDWVVLMVLTDQSGFAVGVVTALQFLPQLLLSIPAGMVADRFNRRRIIQICQCIVALSGLTTGILLLTGVAALWQIYIIALITGVADCLTSPARQAFVSELVTKEDLPNAVGLNSTAFNSARLIGPGLAGFMIAGIGPGWVFIANCVLFIVPVLGLAFMDTNRLFSREKTSRTQGMMREGLRYVQNRTDIKAIIAILTVVGALGMNFQLTQAVMATRVFGKGAGEYGLLGSIMAIGALAGALQAARRRQPRVFTVVLSAVLFGILEGALALAPTYEIFALLLIPTGFVMLNLLTSANATIQVSTDEEIRGRVLSIYFLFFLGTTPIGAPIIGWVAEHWGPRWSLGVGAIASLLVALIVGIWLWRHWQVDVTVRASRPFLTIEGPRERAMRRRNERAERQRIMDNQSRDTGN